MTTNTPVQEYRGLVVKARGWDLADLLSVDNTNLEKFIDIALDTWKKPIDSVRESTTKLEEAKIATERRAATRNHRIGTLFGGIILNVGVGHAVFGQSLSALGLSPVIELAAAPSIFTLTPYIIYDNYRLDATYRAQRELRDAQDLLRDTIRKEGIRDYTLALAVFEVSQAYRFFESDGLDIPNIGDRILEIVRKNYQIVDDSPDALGVIGNAMLKLYVQVSKTDLPDKTKFMESLKEAINEITSALTGEHIFRDDVFGSTGTDITTLGTDSPIRDFGIELDPPILRRNLGQ